MKKNNGPRILILDIETAPIEARVWGLWENNVALNQIVKDWHLMSWGAKWLDEPKFMYMDQRKKDSKHIHEDKALLEGIWKLLDAADVVITHNGKKFDFKKLNARFVLNGLQPPSSVRHIDTLVIAKKHFAFTSNKLEYLSDKLCIKYKKQKHHKFAGFELWAECLAGNQKAWQEMEKYNKYDVLAVEELHKKLIPYDNTINFSVYRTDFTPICSCGSTEFINKGYNYTNVGRYRRFKCKKCGSESKERKNRLSDVKKASLRVRTVR